MDTKNLILKSVGGELRKFLSCPFLNYNKITEIRVRQDKPLIIIHDGKEIFISKEYKKMYCLSGNEYKPTNTDISRTLELLSNYSLYAFADELKNGFITIEGGHRIGICGQAITENGIIKSLKNINGLNIRISRQVIGCSDGIMNMITYPRIKNTLIISPPGCGKTTLIRDIARNISNGFGTFSGINVGICDERSEIAGTYLGVIQNDIGIRSDVLDSSPKSTGMLTLLRSMSPDTIIADEIGSHDDIQAIHEILKSGVNLICSAHGYDIADVRKKPVLSEIINRKIFELYIVLEKTDRPGIISRMYDKEFNEIE